MNKQNHAIILRFARKIHRYLGIFLFLFFFIVAITGLLLGWKNNSNGTILPKTQKGITNNAHHFLSIAELSKIALTKIQKLKPNQIWELDRIDVRTEKGLVKFTFKDSFWEIQLDASNGNMLQTAYRYSDIFEKIHDGSIIDMFFGIKNSIFKLLYCTIMGVSLFGFTITGFWLWFGPKLMRK
jgi:uncharacterized iron-regulated membrane protein